MAFLSKVGKYYYIIVKKHGKVVFKKSTKETLKANANLKLSRFNQEGKSIFRQSEIKATELFKSFMESHTQYADSTIVTKQGALNNFIDILGNKYIELYTSKDIEKLLIEKEKISLETAARIRRDINAVFNWALKQNYLSENPLNTAKRYKRKESDPHFIKQEDFEDLLTRIKDEQFKDILTFAAYTGARSGEICYLRPEHLDVKKRIISFINDDRHRTKGKRTRHVEMHKKIIPIYDKYKDREFLFLNPITKKHYEVRALNDNLHLNLERCKFPVFRFKDLRSTYGMWLLYAGQSLKFISQQLGHSSITVTERHYAKFLTNIFTGRIDSI